LESLLERKVTRVAGRRDVPGRPLVYVTTPLFLETFCLNDLKGLPTLTELGDEFTNMAEQAGFNEAGDDDAAILPLEGEDSEQQAQGEQFEGREALDQDGAEEARQGRDEDEVENGARAGGRRTQQRQGHAEATEETDAQEPDGSQDGDDIPKIRFRMASGENDDDETDDEDVARNSQGTDD
jgi:hypothetical protein